MADLKKRLQSNVEGEFYVDSTCIDCDTCRQLAPTVFTEADDFSTVYHQPQTNTEIKQATQALLACPTGSIGTVHANHAKATMEDFPLHIADNVYYNGFNSPKSFGGNSYFVIHPQGNWLIDSPKFLPHLVNRFEEWGGIRYLFLTHQDDVADAARYAEHFGCQRIIHKIERAAQPDAEILIEGYQPVEIEPEFLVIPTPGHSPGHCVLLYRNHYLFTGDHLAWERDIKGLSSAEYYVWNYAKETESVEILSNYTFSWVLPGHGQRIELPPAVMRQEIVKLVDRMKAGRRRRV